MYNANVLKRVAPHLAKPQATSSTAILFLTQMFQVPTYGIVALNMDSRLSNGLSGDSEHLSRINYGEYLLSFHFYCVLKSNQNKEVLTQMLCKFLKYVLQTKKNTFSILYRLSGE